VFVLPGQGGGHRDGLARMTPAPEIVVSEWFNSEIDLTLAGLRGKVVVIEAFQMLCPGCILHGIPLARKVARAFPADKVAVIGLHCVFEHHAAMTPVSLRAFLHEFGVTFPVGVDAAGPGDIPQTMAAYGLRGTPTLLLVDRRGNLRADHFGEVSELRVGAEIATLMGEADA
jgi:thiol-disulfide isomerase/thioredoxin